MLLNTVRPSFNTKMLIIIIAISRIWLDCPNTIVGIVRIVCVRNACLCISVSDLCVFSLCLFVSVSSHWPRCLIKNE